MYNAKIAIATALSTDASLLALVPKTRMFDGDAAFDGKQQYPYITFAELANIPGLLADDAEAESEITFRIHIWHSGQSTSAIAAHVNRIMTSIGFCRSNSYDQDEVLETGERIKRKILSFTGTFPV